MLNSKVCFRYSGAQQKTNDSWRLTRMVTHGSAGKDLSSVTVEQSTDLWCLLIQWFISAEVTKTWAFAHWGLLASGPSTALPWARFIREVCCNKPPFSERGFYPIYWGCCLSVVVNLWWWKLGLRATEYISCTGNNMSIQITLGCSWALEALSHAIQVSSRVVPFGRYYICWIIF